MSSFEPNSSNAAPRLRKAVLVGMVGLLAFSSACTVRPLYSNAPLSAGSTVGARAELSSIAVKPVDSRYAQQVRNHLIYGLTGGGGEPANPVYSLDLAVSETVESSAVVQVTKEIDEPTSGTVTLKADYRLIEIATGKVVASGSRTMTSSFDKPKQEFAVMRAQIDAENRAARELASLLQLKISQDLAKRS